MGASAETTHSFRPEIAGLRAIAVIGVILFHLKITIASGGFVGVDIFFVISGYLITRKLLTDMAASRFSFGDFYVRRSRRIFPALIATVIATYIAGAIWCSPEMFLQLAKECTHALLSISNIQYWRESSQYFAPTADELTLLHCWSLSLEEQFYLIWPVFVLLAWKTGRPFVCISAAAAISLAASIAVSGFDTQATFFLMPFRVFEFAIGALVLPLARAVPLSQRGSEAVTSGGLVAILWCVSTFNPSDQSKDIGALLPCLGAAALIWAGSQTLTSKVLTNPLAIVIGGISYSLYLCHWPIIFFGHFIFGDAADSGLGQIISIVLMLAIASAMSRFVERPFLRQQTFLPASFKTNAFVLCLVVLPLVAITHATFRNEGFAWRVPDRQSDLQKQQGLVSICGYGGELCSIGAPHAKPAFMLVGDSYTAPYGVGLDADLRKLNSGAAMSMLAGCLLLDGVFVKGWDRNRCAAWRKATLRRLRETDLPIIWAQDWESYPPLAERSADTSPLDALQTEIESTLSEIVSNGRRIMIIGAQVRSSCRIDRARLLPGPLPHVALKPCPPMDRKLVEQSNSAINQLLLRVQSKWPQQIVLFFPEDYFCDETCPIVRGGIWLYFDAGHFSLAGSNYLMARAEPAFRSFLGL